MSTPEFWRIQLFGPLRLTSGERTVTRFRTQMTGSLLAYLAHNGGRPQPRETLIDMFWPDADPKAGRGRLSIALTSLRSQLSPAGQGAELVVADSFAVGLNPALFETDTAAFLGTLTRAARASGPAERGALLEESLSHYGGDFLTGYYDAWVVPEQERLREQFLKAAAELIRLREQAGEPRRALGIARRMVETAPLHEDAWLTLMRLLAASGEADEARRCFDAMCDRFTQDGCAPSPRAVAFLNRLPKPTDPPTVQVPPAAPITAVPTAPALPAGTVTVLLAEGDTAGLAGIRDTSGRRGGVEIPAPEGAARFLFADAHAAVSAVVEAMRTDNSPSLRAALDTGLVESTAGNYVGAPLDSLPRLLGAAHAGQVVCTGATATLARPRGNVVSTDTEGNGPVRLRDLGLYRLREDDTPERLFQVEAADQSPVSFPPLRAAAGYASTLPPAYTRFFGRTEEVARVTRLLTAGTGMPLLLTLTGMGGMGKTRLALEAAAGAREAFAGRVWFVPLAALRDAARIPAAIRDSLRLPADPATDPLEQAAALLSEAPALLVLDNLEQLTAGGAAALALRALRERVPSLSCLVTSRQMIGVEGERALPVGPLPLPFLGPDDSPDAIRDNACVQLFVDRARAARPDFAVTASNAPALARLCAVLEGIPLALELAAARVSLLTPAQMLSQVESRFALLRSRRRDLPERHRSLWAAVDSSYQLLSPEQQRFFACLSLFRGGWTLEAAATVCQAQVALPYTPADVLESLAELQECSLIYAEDDADTGDGSPRFRMLETLREFASERLQECGEGETARERHRRFFGEMAAAAEPLLSAGGDGQNEWLDRLEADHENLRAVLDRSDAPSALRTAVLLHRFWLFRGHVAEGRRRLSALLALPSEVPETDRARALNAAGVLAWAAGALDDAEGYFTECLALYRRCAGPPELARALNNLGIVASQRGNFAAARVSFEESLSLYRALGDALGQSRVLTNLGAVLVYLNDFDAAQTAMEESLPIQRAAADGFSVLRTLQNLAEVACRREDYTVAANALTESLVLRRSLGDRSMIWDALATAAAVACGWGRWADAAILLGTAEATRTAVSAEQTPADAEYSQRTLDQLQRRLPTAELIALQERGRKTAFDRAVEIAEHMLAQGPATI